MTDLHDWYSIPPFAVGMRVVADAIAGREGHLVFGGRSVAPPSDAHLKRWRVVAEGLSTADLELLQVAADGVAAGADTVVGPEILARRLGELRAAERTVAALAREIRTDARSIGVWWRT